MDADALRQWISVLDTLSYYNLFRVRPTATIDELKYAFHAFAESFHPDAHSWRPPGERDAIGTIFRRGTEAYRVLSDPTLRFRYDQALAGGDVRSQEIVVGMQNQAAGNPASQRLIDKIRAPGARPFVIRAEELFKKGDAKQAKIQLVLAMHLEGQNPALLAFSKELEAAVQKQSADAKKNWKKT